ncbi:MAG TPA: ATP-binding protein [Thermoanaerobaculia bacterium]|nr:ATP-binding protein [Thermoanaerobaculia bacterium]
MAEDLAAYEKLGAFYLGRPYDLERGEASLEPLLYDSRDLLTHAVCIGMTGSGKTGLLISLIEEAAIDRIPALVIDPKGDLANLLLTFPELRPADFAPWIDADAAARAGLTPEAFAAKEAETWREGLARWGQSGERIARLRDAAELTVYTPGSEAGLPVSILSSLEAPPPEILADGDLLRERVTTLVASLLSLLGLEADPVRGRESILLATIFDAAWRQGKGLDLAALIQQIQKPPVERIGVMDLESFYPAKERFELAMAVNNLLGSPGFGAWLHGEPLDVNGLLYTPSGKPRVSIFSIAHLSDRERMFFVSLLLNQVLGWARSRPGTSSLRALLCMDEVFGYMPPVAEPPSKRPLLTLLKQARAFGLGLVLASQNPVDLDYKGLGNVGTWFLGRLQTERDKQRLLDGLEGAAGGGFDRARIGEILSGLGNRVFLLHNVHEEGPVVFQTRWAMSYLRGPLTRPELKRLMDPRKQAPPAARVTAQGPTAGVTPQAAAASTAPAAAAVAPAVSRPSDGVAELPPVLPPDIPQSFLPVRSRPDSVVYEPHLYAAATVHYVEPKAGIDHAEDLFLLATLQGAGETDWYAAESVEVEKESLEPDPVDGARFCPLPAPAARARSYDGWRKGLEDCLYRTRRLEVFRSANFGALSQPGETERDFRIRLGDQARERRDEQIEALRRKHGPKVAQFQDRIRRAEQSREKQEAQASSQTWHTVISAGTAVMGALFGRKTFSYGNVNRAGSAMRSVGRTFQERKDVAHAEENIESLKKQLADLNTELETEVDRLEERLDPEAEELEILGLKPRRKDIEVRILTLAWAPKRDGEPVW